MHQLLRVYLRLPNIRWVAIRPILAAKMIEARSLSFASVLLVLIAASAVADLPASQSADTTPVIGIDLSTREYEDGVYRGEATGYRPGFVVEVTVEGGRVSGVRVVEHNEVRIVYWRRAIRILPGEIVKRQSTGIDALSGATATSNGIFAAVENALGEEPPTTEEQPVR